jgi:tRNA pseudouridine38-40 synthase
MPRYFLEIAYKGTNYHGWQIQANAHTVQAELNQALAHILRYPVDTIGSGRTDTGVHARQQFVHFDTAEAIADTQYFMYRLNACLPEDLAAYRIFAVSPQANVRHDAISRSYEFHIHRQKNPFLHTLSYHYNYPLNLDKMNEAAQILLNYTDFESFSKVKTDVDHFECTISEARWEEKGKYLIFHITANRFLRGMVRTLVGTMLDIGREKTEIADFEKIIQARDRRKAGRIVPPEGLYLTAVRYPKEIIENS